MKKSQRDTYTPSEDFEDLTLFANESFDVVMTSLMMHHVPDTQKAISEMVRTESS